MWHSCGTATELFQFPLLRGHGGRGRRRMARVNDRHTVASRERQRRREYLGCAAWSPKVPAEKKLSLVRWYAEPVLV